MDIDPTAAPQYEVGILVERTEEVVVEPSGHPDQTDNPYTDAAGRHRMGSTGGPDSPNRLTQLGETAVKTAARAIASQIGLVTDEISAELERRATTKPAPDKLGIDEAKITFGLKLTASTSAGLSALFTAKSESNVEVAITIRRQTT